MDKIKFKKLSKTAIMPKRQSLSAAGYDLYSDQDNKIIKAGEHELIKTNIAMKIPVGYYGRVASRSSLSYKYNLEVGAGVIDADYRGGIGVILRNHSKKNYVFNHGDRIAQLIITKIICPELEEVDELDSTERGSGGYGSTGK